MTSDLIVTLTCTALPITLREKFTGEVVQDDDRAGKVNALDMKSWKGGLDSLNTRRGVTP